MKKIIYLFLGVFLLLSLSSCEDLEVENLNEPKFEETNVPAQVNGTAAGLIRGWHFAGHNNYQGDETPGNALWVAADVGSCSYGNFGMRDISSEPRVVFNNTPAYANMTPFEKYYKNLYATCSNASDVLKSIAVAGDGAIEKPMRAKAVAKFVQGTCLGYIGLLYDKGFVVTENTDITVPVPMVDYAVLIDSAVAILDDAIEICSSDTFDIPQAWLPAVFTYTNVEFKQLVNTMAARLLAYKSRNANQNESNDWAKIKSYAQNGLTFDFEPVMDDNVWWDYLKVYAVYSGWGRVDMRVINMMDSNMPAWFPPSGKIADLPNDGIATSADKRLETDFEYLASQGFSPERGIYHFSTYRYSRFDYYLETWTEPVAIIRKAENDMLLAEAYVRTGDLAGAASILNDPANSRKDRGGLADVSADKDELLNAIYYEKTIECMLTGECVEFYDMRRRDMLQSGTFLHLPIPAQQLEVLQLDFYSFGGTTGVAGVDYSTGGWETKPGYERPNY